MGLLNATDPQHPGKLDSTNRLGRVQEPDAYCVCRAPRDLASPLEDETPVRSLCSRTVCTRCGMIGADVRPDGSPAVKKKRA